LVKPIDFSSEAYRRLSVFRELGVRRVINAVGTLTSLGGSLIDAEVLEAMDEAAASFVYVEELLRATGRRVAQITKAEAGYVTSGAAAGLVLSIAACITKGDFVKTRKLPNTEGMKNEVILQRPHGIDFAHLSRFTGAKIVEVGTADKLSEQDIELAINDRTAAILHIILDPQPGTVSLERIIEIGKRHHIPVVVDAAAELPPVDNLSKFISMGADLVVFSGGKAIGGPNDSGFICGRKDLIHACALNGFPSESVIGRTMKISKEQIVGLVVALQRYAEKDHEADMERWKAMTNWLVDELSGIPHVKAVPVFPSKGPRPLCIPRVEVTWDERALNKSTLDVVNSLKSGDPAIEVANPEHSIGEERIHINPQCLRDGEEKIVATRLQEIFSEFSLS